MVLQIYKNLEQGTPEWLDVRLWVITWTWLWAIMWTKACRQTYLTKLCAELRRVNNPQVKNFAMQRGNDLEDICQLEYEKLTWNKVENIGFATRNPYWGHSPDGIIYNDDWIIYKGIEIKSPYWETILKYLSKDGNNDAEILYKIDTWYYWQVINYFCIFPDMEELDFLVFYPYDTTLNRYQKTKRFKEIDLEKYKTGSTLEDEIFIYTIKREDVIPSIADAKDEVKLFRDEWETKEEEISQSKINRGLNYITKNKWQ